MFTITVRPDGQEPFEVTATTRDVLNWEKVGKDNNIAKLQAQQSVVDMYSIAHFACKRQQLFTGTLAEFEQNVDIDFDDDGQEDGADPTQSGR